MGIVKKSIKLDTDVMKSVAQFRGGINPPMKTVTVAGELDAALTNVQ